MKHKLLITGLATATLLSTAALTHYSTSVYAEGEETAVTRQDVADYFADLEKQAEEAINKNDKIKDKEVAILEAKAAIGKEDLLKAIDEKQITPEEVLKDLAEASKTESDEAEPGKYGDDYAPEKVKDAKPAPGAELVRNEAGEVTEVKPLNGGIDADAQDKINKRLDEENTDVKDAEERLAAAKHDEKEAESNREEAKAAVESAKENVKAAQDELAAAKEAKAKYEKELENYKDAEGEQADQYREAARADIEKAEAVIKKAEATLKQAEKEAEEAKAALEQADEDYYSYVADREAEEIRVLRRQIAKDKADGKDTTALEEELDIALNGVKPAVNEVKPYEGPVTGFFDETGENPIAEGELGTLAPRNIPGYTYTGTSYTKDGILRHIYRANASNSEPSRNYGQPNYKYPAPGTPAPAQTPAATPAPAPAQTPAATPAAEVPATPAEATPAAVAAQAEESKKEELPNTGTAELGLITPAVLSFLAGLGLTFGKKEDK